MAKKVINIKLPLGVATEMDDRAQLNPSFIEHFIIRHLICGADFSPHDEFTLTYTCKVSEELYNTIQLYVVDTHLTTGEMLGRLFANHYGGK